MTAEAIGALAPLATPTLDALPEMAPTAGAAPVAEGFGTWFAQEVGSVNASLARADGEVRALAAGASGSLHEVMIHLEEARLSFQLLAQVRNRLLEAYQEVMRMQL